MRHGRATVTGLIAAASFFLAGVVLGLGPDVAEVVRTPSAKAATQSVTIRWGPYSVPAAAAGMPGSTSNLFQWAAAMPCVDCYVTEITPNLVYEDGSTANHETMAMLH